jgi:hypothetical protein
MQSLTLAERSMRQHAIAQESERRRMRIEIQEKHFAQEIGP